jgi:CMP-N,N'-diacetyllegionaminic acid synthase
MIGRTLAVVTARGGSKRLPGKNVMQLGGLSLLGWTASAAREAGLPTPVLSTDDPMIAEEGRRVGLRVPFMRPQDLSGDDVTTLPVVLHALNQMCALDDVNYESVFLLQPTSPFRGAELLKNINDLFVASAAPAVISVRPVGVALGAIYRSRDGTLAPVLARSAEAAYVPSGAGYLIRAQVLESSGSFVPPETRFVEHNGISTLDIDTPTDWALAEAVLATGMPVPDLR